MFIGHYGVALAAKRVTPRTSLGALFIAVQLLDVLFALFVFAGIEKLRIVPGFTQASPLDLYFLPYSHSLVGALLWSALAALIFGLVARAIAQRGGAADWSTPKARVTAALVFGGAVFSHFVLDFPMHTPDLPLGFDAASPKIGLGLWNQLDVTIALEIGTLVVGGALYLGATRPRSGNVTPTVVTGVVLVALAVAAPFLPLPSSDVAFAEQALGAYVALAILAEWMGRSREPAA